MGVLISKYSDISNNEHCQKFCSSEQISHNDPFWNKFLAFNIKPPGNIEEQVFFDASVETLLESFLEHNPRTGNLSSLVQVFITRATELLTQPTHNNVMFAWQTFNALFVIRFVSKYLIEMIPEPQLCLHFDVQIDKSAGKNAVYDAQTSESLDSSEELIQITSDNENKSTTINIIDDQSKQMNTLNISPIAPTVSPRLNVNESKLEMLLDTLVGLIIDVPINDTTYYLHLECVNTLLVLMSVYMFASAHGVQRHIETSLIYRTLYEGRYRMHAPILVRTLLNNFIAMHLAPENLFGHSEQGGGSVVMGLASGIWSILTLSAGAKRESLLQRQLKDPELIEKCMKIDHPLALQSCLLLLAFTNHSINEFNLYRKGLFLVQDERHSDNGKSEGLEHKNESFTPPRINISALHTAVCGTVTCENVTLLLYLLLNGCKEYKRYINNISHVEDLLIPLLHTLYRSPVERPLHLYMSVIALLTLTEDEKFSRSLHQIDIKCPVWYAERALTGLTLGGLCTLVVIRTLYVSTVKLKDQYLHINCLASLANMSGEFRNLHPYVAQRLVSLVESMCKRVKKMVSKTETSECTIDMESSPAVSSENAELMQEALQESIEALRTVLRMLLEIINSCLTNQLSHNLNLVYAILYKKELFEELSKDKEFAAVGQNIEIVIGFFSSRLERARDHAGTELGVTEVLANIQRAAQQWKGDRLKRFPELKFRYIEDERLDEFFTPYVWSLITTCGNIYWTSESSNLVLKDIVVC